MSPIELGPDAGLDEGEVEVAQVAAGDAVELIRPVEMSGSSSNKTDSKVYLYLHFFDSACQSRLVKKRIKLLHIQHQRHQRYRRRRRQKQRMERLPSERVKTMQCPLLKRKGERW